MANFFSNITNLLKRAFSSPSSLIWNIGNAAIYAPIDTQKAVTEGYLSNTAVYSIVNRDAEKFGVIPRYVVRGEDRLNNPLSKLLERPNEYESQDAFFTKARIYRLLTGEAFIWCNRGDTDMITEDGFEKLPDEVHAKKPVLEMYVLPSDYVTVIPGRDLFTVEGYELEFNGSRVPLRKVDVIHWKNTNLLWDTSGRQYMRGISPLSPGYKSLQQINSATDASVRMFDTDGAKGVLFNETLDNLTPDQQKQLDSVIDSKLNNNSVKGRVVQLQGKWDYKSIAGSIDKVLLDAKLLSWQELCFLFGVPYELFDPNTTFANKEQAQKGWVSNTIIPASRQFDGELGRTLLKSFGLEGAAIESDFDALPEMQEDLKEKASWLMTTWPLTPDEVREALGYDPLGGEFAEPWVPGGMTPLSKREEGFDDDMANQLLNAQRGGR